MIKEIYPLKAQFGIDETIYIKILLEKGSSPECMVKVTFYHLGEKVFSKAKIANEMLKFAYKPERAAGDMEGFLVKAEFMRDGIVAECKYTACDRAKSWECAPRYGFLSDFTKDDFDDADDVYKMNLYHINVIQFYDWMYRHDNFFPKQSDFYDIMGKASSMDTVKQKIEYAHKYNMKAFAYGAVYGAESEYYEKHTQEALYDNKHKAIKFIDRIYFMDINRKCEWHKHIINEYKKAADFGFDGIHMDQYGFPKEAYAKEDGKLVLRNLREDFPVLIDDTKSALSDKGIIFNAVNNWPVDTVANSMQDCVYIEVWSPNDTFGDLNRLISDAKKYAPTKQVILAAYLHSFKVHNNKSECENSALLTMATIFSSGGFHLLIGEGDCLLTEAYYPDYYNMENSYFAQRMRNYYDFITAYEELLFSFSIIDNTRTYTGGINEEYIFSGSDFSVTPEPDKIWTQVKAAGNYKIIHLVNFKNIKNMNWNETQTALPRTVDNITVNMQTAQEIETICLASPDFERGMSRALDFSYVTRKGGQSAVEFTVPKLSVWDMVYIKIKS